MQNNSFPKTAVTLTLLWVVDGGWHRHACSSNNDLAGDQKCDLLCLQRSRGIYMNLNYSLFAFLK